MLGQRGDARYPSTPRGDPSLWVDVRETEVDKVGAEVHASHPVIGDILEEGARDESRRGHDGGRREAPKEHGARRDFHPPAIRRDVIDANTHVTVLEPPQPVVSGCTQSEHKARPELHGDGRSQSPGLREPRSELRASHGLKFAAKRKLEVVDTTLKNRRWSGSPQARQLRESLELCPIAS
jgi:hypothetical protein